MIGKNLHFWALFFLVCSLGVLAQSVGANQESVFLSQVQKRLGACPVLSDMLTKRLLQEYGSIWINADPEILLPAEIIFANASSTDRYQSRLGLSQQGSCKLQTKALSALEAAQKQAKAEGLTLSARGNDSCLRNYEGTVRLWLSRVEPNLNYYQAQGKLSAVEAKRIRGANTREQIELVLDLEAERGLLFDKFRQTSILNSVAAPGSSQHLTGLAFDLAEFASPRARSIMNEHGWYQTIQADLPHFTYLGRAYSEAEFDGLGLKKQKSQGYTFWVPNF